MRLENYIIARGTAYEMLEDHTSHITYTFIHVRVLL